MSPKVFEVVRRYGVGVMVELYEIDLTPIGGSVLRFTNNVFEERVPIKFGGFNYTQMPISMDEIEVDSQSAPAQPRFQIATSGGPVAALLSQYRDLKGAYIRKFTTFAEFLDIMPDPNNEGEMIDNPGKDVLAIINEDMFVVDRKIAADPTGAELQLVAPTDQEGVMLPLRIVRKRWCDSAYRVQDPTQPDGFFYFEPVDGGCPWRGTTYFDINDQPCEKAKDRCSKQATGCIARFGKTATLPMSAFPGIRSTQEAG